MYTETITYKGKEITIEMVGCYDFARDYSYFSVFVTIKQDYQRYEIGKAESIENGIKKAKKFIKEKI